MQKQTLEEILEKYQEWRIDEKGDVILQELSRQQALLAIQQWALGLVPEDKFSVALADSEKFFSLTDESWNSCAAQMKKNILEGK